MQRKSRFLLAISVCFILAAMLSPSVALAKRATNYGYDWQVWPYYNVDMYDAAARSAYYQQLKGYTTMDRDRGLGLNIYTKLAGIDAYNYDIINVISHGGYFGLAARPKDDYAFKMSCLYQSSYDWGVHGHSIGVRYETCGGYMRVNTLSSVPYVKWMVLQGCDTAYGTTNIASVCCAEGVDTTVGFYDTIYFGGVGTNGKSIQYNFAARYWKTLYEGGYNSEAMDDGRDQVLLYNGSYYGYQYHRAYGINGKI
ncbi:MAG: hypothetical protein Q8K99_11425 [Actinomycetota bacterium]|nr:hypothetical protein [Actinomycetota bacterium]